MLRAPWTIGILVATATPAWGQAPSTEPATAAAPAKPSAETDPAAKKRARKLARNARKLVRQQRYAEAIPGFEAAFGLWPLPLLRLELARCHEQSGDPLTALSLVEAVHEALEKTKDKDAVAVEAERLRAAVRERWGQASVTSVPEGAAATLTLQGGGEGPTAGKTPLTRWLAPGIWTIEVSAQGYAPQTARITVTAGAHMQQAMRLESLEAIAKAEAEARERERREREAEAAIRAAAERRRREAERQRLAAIEAARQARIDARRNVAWMVLGSGAGLTAGGVFFGILARDAIDDLEDLKGSPRSRRAIDRAHAVASSRAVSANLLLTAGLGTVAGGAWLLYKSMQEDAPRAAPAQPPPPGQPEPPAEPRGLAAPPATTAKPGSPTLPEPPPRAPPAERPPAPHPPPQPAPSPPPLDGAEASPSDPPEAP